MEQRSFLWNCGERNMKMNEEGYNQVALLAAKMFAGIRYFFAKYVRNKLNAFFLDPMLQKVGSMVVNHFYRLPSKKYEDMFLGGIEELKNVQEKLTRQLAACTQQRDRFKEIYFRMQQTQFKSPSSFDLNQK